MDPATITLLKGLGSSGAVGAGAGAVGMGVANLLSPKDPNDSEPKSRSLLKSMLLGGALGGAAGLGGRAVANTAYPDLQHDPSSGVGWLMNKVHTMGQPQAEQHNPISTDLKNVAANWPKGTAFSVGALTSSATIARNKLNKNYFDEKKFSPAQVEALNPSTKKMYEYLDTAPKLRMSKFPMMHPVAKGGIVGGATYLLSKILQHGEQTRQNYEINNNPDSLRSLIQQRQAGQQ